MKSGTIVTCPVCEEHQIKSTKDLFPGAQMKDAAWESCGYDMEHASRMGCKVCGSEWFREHPKTGHSQIHTKDNGWVSFEKEKPKEQKETTIIT